MTEMRQKSHPEDSIPLPQQNGQQIDTGGGATVDGDASVGHDFIGRDRITIGQVVVVMGGSRQEVAVKSAPAEGESPYRGLEIFNVADAALFFGREQSTGELVTALRETSFLAVVGASGSGKSSLVRAGLIPALQQGELPASVAQFPRGSRNWPVHIILPSDDPLMSLAASLTWDESVADQLKLTDTMRQDSRSLNAMAHRVLSRQDAGGDQLLLVVDQFEEIFTRCHDREVRQAFVDNLMEAADGGVTKVVITLRADFYHHCAEFDNLRQAVQDHQAYIGAMSREELRESVEEPARLGNWEFEPGLVDLILDDVVDQPGGLPLLSHALLETWKRREGRKLTLAGYRDAGGVSGAIAHTADETYASLSPQQQAIAKSLFLRLTELGEGAQDTRRRVPMDELTVRGEDEAAVQDVIKRLADARLVTTSKEQPKDDSAPPADGEPSPNGEDNGKPGGEQEIYVDVAHEALIREWGTLREWLQDDREGLRLHRRLTDATEAWERLNRDPDALYRGAELDQARTWADQHPDALNTQEEAFLAASGARARLDRTRTLGFIAAILLLVAGIIGVIIWGQRQVIQAQHATATQQAESAAKIEAGATAEAVALVSAEAAHATAVANLDLANQQLARLEGQRLLGDARSLKADLDYGTAIQTFRAAMQADPDLDIDLSKEISETLRYAALHMVYDGEELALQGNAAAAAEKFQEAVSLNPPADTPVYVWIDAGAFQMGSDSAGDSKQSFMELPQHTVNLDGFWIMRTEVTNEQYARCVAADVCTAPDNDRWHRTEYAREPVTNVSWNQAKTYAEEWAGGRLPTEAEWEKACRGGDGRIYPWGDDEPARKLLNYAASGLNGVVAVGSYPSGAYGLYDMAGNVAEWTSSKWKDYPYDAGDGREDPEGDEIRTVRGGSFGNAGYDGSVRCAYRDWGSKLSAFESSGFRVASGETPN